MQLGRRFVSPLTIVGEWPSRGFSDRGQVLAVFRLAADIPGLVQLRVQMVELSASSMGLPMRKKLWEIRALDLHPSSIN